MTGTKNNNLAKTNTQDPVMLDSAEQMMREVGSAAWFIIDTTEEFHFAQGVNTNGDVYNNLIKFCNNEVSLLVSGAIIGQDTQYSNYSKGRANIAILDCFVDADKRMIENYIKDFFFYNSIMRFVRRSELVAVMQSDCWVLLQKRIDTFFVC